MSVSLWNKKEHERKTYDVVIIGGGISGLSTAYWLQKYGLKIAIIEKYTCGTGATGRNAGFITCGSVEHFNRIVGKHGIKEALEIWKFSEDNLQLLKDEIIKNKDLGFEQNGSFSLASTLSEFKELQESARLMSANNIAVEILNKQDVINRLGVVDFVGGIKYKNDATINPILLLNELLSLLNIDLYENSEVFSVKNNLIQTSTFDFTSDIIIYALNGYSSLMDSYFNDKIYPTKGQALSTEKADSFMEGACYANSFLDYFRQAKSGEFVIGGFRQEDTTDDIYSDVINPVVDGKLEEFIQKHIPQLKNKKIIHKWSGVMGFSTDGQPMVGSIPSSPNIFYLGGYTGHGLGLAFHCAKVLVDLIMTGKNLPNFLSGKRF